VKDVSLPYGELIAAVMLLQREEDNMRYEYSLYAANSTEMHTYGIRTLALDFEPIKSYKLNFVYQ
jgi:hypothetical protein